MKKLFIFTFILTLAAFSFGKDPEKVLDLDIVKGYYSPLKKLPSYYNHVYRLDLANEGTYGGYGQLGRVINTVTNDTIFNSNPYNFKDPNNFKSWDNDKKRGWAKPGFERDVHDYQYEEHPKLEGSYPSCKSTFVKLGLKSILISPPSRVCDYNFERDGELYTKTVINGSEQKEKVDNVFRAIYRLVLRDWKNKAILGLDAADGGKIMVYNDYKNFDKGYLNLSAKHVDTANFGATYITMDADVPIRWDSNIMLLDMNFFKAFDNATNAGKTGYFIFKGALYTNIDDLSKNGFSKKILPGEPLFLIIGTDVYLAGIWNKGFTFFTYDDIAKLFK